MGRGGRGRSGRRGERVGEPGSEVRGAETRGEVDHAFGGRREEARCETEDELLVLRRGVGVSGLEVYVERTGVASSSSSSGTVKFGIVMVPGVPTTE